MTTTDPIFDEVLNLYLEYTGESRESVLREIAEDAFQQPTTPCGSWQEHAMDFIEDDEVRDAVWKALSPTARLLIYAHGEVRCDAYNDALERSEYE